jgi:hypothetical protein
MSDAEGLSETTLLYLVADRLVSGTAWSAIPASMVPGSTKQLNTLELASLLCAVALWRLRENSVVRLDLQRARRRTRVVGALTHRVSDDVVVRRGRDARTRGLERALQTGIREGHASHVASVVAGFVHSEPTATAAFKALRVTVDEAHQAGMLVEGTAETKYDDWLARQLGRSLMADLDKVAALKTRSSGLAAEWHDFGRTEHRLRRALMASCNAGLLTRQSVSVPLGSTEDAGNNVVF